MLKLARLLLYFFIFLIPFQYKVIYYSTEAYYSGFFNPYLTFFLYLPDIFYILGILFFGISLIFSNRIYNFIPKNKYLFFLITLFLFAIGLSILFSTEKVISLLVLLRFIQFFSVFYLISIGFIKNSTVLRILVIAVSVSAVIGLLQFINHGSIGLNFLGEPLLSVDSNATSTLGFLDEKILRSYGTFPHPNLFAAYLAFCILVSFQYLGRYKFLFILLLSLGLIFTFSRSVLFALFISLIIYFLIEIKSSKLRYFVIFILLFLFSVLLFYEPIRLRFILGDSAGFIERINYMILAKNMIVENPLGVGLGTFTALGQSFLGTKLMPWLFQPVHNLIILVLSETGIFGALTFLLALIYPIFYILKKSRTSKYAYLISLWVFIIIISQFDHYLLTLYQGQALLFLFWAQFNL
ncbi:hypothetical protein GF354_05395 [Candidatus Peregrinibacteria bacterium]|nr:hypothetical protein [Candidatus Peregrinibacteria bacterium]